MYARSLCFLCTNTKSKQTTKQNRKQINHTFQVVVSLTDQFLRQDTFVQTRCSQSHESG
eukprot:m.50005 g.50005  ORF g.50005 m.50005 type:complete len:59 (-) comp11131_c0_seq1:18-194(-)